MDKVTFHFYGDVNYFLPPERKNTPFVHDFDWQTSIKDMIESFGPPHTEIELLVVNGVSVDFEYQVMPDDRVDVYTRAESCDLARKVPLRPPYPLIRPRFVLDTHMGRLAGYLRLLGYDTLYRNDYPDDELAQISHDETRILLTRDIGLLKRSMVTYGRWVRATDPRQKLAEVLRHYNLIGDIRPFTVCLRCNGRLHPVEKATISDQLEPRTAEFYDEFHQCADCAQIYWRGSHYVKLLAFIDEIANSSAQSSIES
ncbi:MAG: Mut7-C RNAse domain-containing protein [Aggregatilineales bacterium]